MTARVRFAPSPTGHLHLGSIRTVLVNVLYAKNKSGTFIWRIEDTDKEREVAGAEAQMMEDLAWLGITPDESPDHGGDFGPYRDSERDAAGEYKTAVDKLMADGRAYECFVTPTELDVMRRVQRAQNQMPRYDNSHRNLTEEQKAAFRAEGKEPVIRFRLEDNAPVTINDVVRGDINFETQNLGGDPVIVRSNGSPLFALSGTVNDIAQKMDLVIRGDDHIANTAVQIQIFEALGAKPPQFAHIPLIADKDGSKLSKRKDSLSVPMMRTEGYLPEAIIAYLATLGLGTTAEVKSLDEQAKDFDITKFGKSVVKFDVDQVKRLNAQALHRMTYEEAKPYIEQYAPNLEISDVALFWEAIKTNIQLFSEIETQVDFVFGDIKTSADADDKDFIKEAATLLPEGTYSESTWKEWTSVVKEKTGRKGKQLFLPLRLALTGVEHGPEIGKLLPLMGADVAQKRLEQAAQ